jgi:hypothetical protein
MRTQWVVPTCLMLLVGCGAPTIDATSQETLKASMEKVRASLPEADRARFVGDCMTVSMSAALKGGMLAKKTAPAGTEVLRPLHGMTAEKIHVEAVKVREQLPKRP